MISIEPLKREHIGALTELEKLCFGKSAWTQAGFESELTNPAAVFLTAVCGSEVVGCIAMSDALGQGFISKVMVSPDYRRQRIAASLLESLICCAKERKMFELSLEVRESNIAAQALYEKFGFQKIGLRRKFYHDPVEGAVIMSKSL